MKGQSLKAVGILVLVFALGGLSGITLSQYVDLPIGKQNDSSDRESHLPLFLKRKLTHGLDLTDNQEEQINAHLQEMTQRLDEAKKKFKPMVDNIFDSTYAKIKAGLTEEQWSQLQENRERIRHWLSRKRHKDRKHHRDDDKWDDKDRKDRDDDGPRRDWQDKWDDKDDHDKPGDGRRDDPEKNGAEKPQASNENAELMGDSPCVKDRLLEAFTSFWILGEADRGPPRFDICQTTKQNMCRP